MVIRHCVETLAAAEDVCILLCSRYASIHLPALHTISPVAIIKIPAGNMEITLWFSDAKNMWREAGAEIVISGF